MVAITRLMRSGRSEILSEDWQTPLHQRNYQNNIESRSGNSMRLSSRLKPELSMTRLMLKWNSKLLLTACLILVVTQVTGCASSHPLPVVQCQTIPPPPAMAMKKYKPVYRQRLQDELLESVSSATK